MLIHSNNSFTAVNKLSIEDYVKNIEDGSQSELADRSLESAGYYSKDLCLAEREDMAMPV